MLGSCYNAAPLYPFPPSAAAEAPAPFTKDSYYQPVSATISIADYYKGGKDETLKRYAGVSARGGFGGNAFNLQPNPEPIWPLDSKVFNDAENFKAGVQPSLEERWEAGRKAFEAKKDSTPNWQ